MKKKGHPEYQDILFVDSSTGYKFVCGSTLKPEETEAFEGREYPVYRVPISSSSHPFFTGSKQFVDTEGRVDKFKKRYAKKRDQGRQQHSEDSKEEKKNRRAARKKAAQPKKK